MQSVPATIIYVYIMSIYNQQSAHCSCCIIFYTLLRYAILQYLYYNVYDDHVYYYLLFIIKRIVRMYYYAADELAVYGFLICIRNRPCEISFAQ